VLARLDRAAPSGAPGLPYFQSSYPFHTSFTFIIVELSLPGLLANIYIKNIKNIPPRVMYSSACQPKVSREKIAWTLLKNMKTEIHITSLIPPQEKI
jgi:hypothetical protein